MPHFLFQRPRRGGRRFAYWIDQFLLKRVTNGWAVGVVFLDSFVYLTFLLPFFFASRYQAIVLCSLSWIPLLFPFSDSFLLVFSSSYQCFPWFRCKFYTPFFWKFLLHDLVNIFIDALKSFPFSKMIFLFVDALLVYSFAYFSFFSLCV